jgi:hypothetical protein
MALGTVTPDTVRRVPLAQRFQRVKSFELSSPRVGGLPARTRAVVTHRLVGVHPPAPSAVWSTGVGQRVNYLTIFCSTMS